MNQKDNDLTDLSRLSPLGRKLVEGRHRIFEHWEKMVKKEILQARAVSHPALIDTLPAFIANLAEALTPSFLTKPAIEISTIAHEHGGERARVTLYGVENLIREYQLLRLAIFDFIAESNTPMTVKDTAVMDIFIDNAIRESVIGFSLVQSDIRERFIATLSHDLRNPIGAAHMAAQMIVRRPSSSDVPETAGKIVANLKRMDRMIQDLLDTTLLKTGERIKLDLEEVDMREILDEAISQATMAYGERFKVTIVPCVGFWSKGALHRALDNLIGNAVKYGDPEKPIEITSHCEHGRILISVHNDGPPIALEDQEAIFQTYRRTESAKNGNKKGWGLGLALVRGVAESHGGSIVLKSAPERGTTFTIDIPVDARPFQDAPVS